MHILILLFLVSTRISCLLQQTWPVNVKKKGIRFLMYKHFIQHILEIIDYWLVKTIQEYSLSSLDVHGFILIFYIVSVIRRRVKAKVSPDMT